MEQELITIIDEEKEHVVGRFVGDCFLIAAAVQSESGRTENNTYTFSDETVKKLRSIISLDEFVSSFRNGHLEWLDRFLQKNDIAAGKTTYSLPQDEERFGSWKRLQWTFYEDDSDYNGDDFEYTYYFDEENSEKLRQLMFSDGRYGSVREWMKANVRDQETGSDFQSFCIRNGIHGEREVYEDYPGGVHYTEDF